MKINKKIIVFIFVFILAISQIKCAYAGSSIGSIISQANNFIGQGNTPETVIKTENLKNTSDFLYKVLMSIGIVVIFIVGTILGIQFMVATVEEKAKIKESLIPFIVGCVVILGAFTIWSIVVNIGQKVVP